MPTAVQYAYVSNLLGVALPPPDPAGGAAPGGLAPGGAAETVLPATDSELFFDRDSAVLTASDTGALDVYAVATSGGTEPITVSGYASSDGDPAHNSKLATARALAVQKYLIGKGIDAGRITAQGQGATAQFGEKDPSSNRRVVLTPKPPAKPAAAPVAPKDEYDPLPVDAPVSPTRGALPPELRLTQKQFEKSVGTDTAIARDQVEKEFTDFLETLMQNQGGTSLRITDTVRFAGVALGKGLKAEMGLDAKLRDNGINRVPRELAHEVAAMLPDKIPLANMNALRAMRPAEVKGPQTFSIASAITKIVTPAVKQAISFLPKSIQEKITGSIEDAVVKGLVGIADKAMEGSALDDATRKAIHSAVEAAIKEKGEAGRK